MKSRLLNFALYEIGWFAIVGGAGSGRAGVGTAIAVALLALHLALIRRPRHELWLMLAAAGVGLVADSAQVAAGRLRFPGTPPEAWLCPPWIPVMWGQFAMTFHFCMRWLLGRPWTALGLGAVGGPLAYLAGVKLGAVQLGSRPWISLVVLGVVWAVALPALLALAGRLGPEVDRYRFEERRGET